MNVFPEIHLDAINRNAKSVFASGEHYNQKHSSGEDLIQYIGKKPPKNVPTRIGYKFGKLECLGYMYGHKIENGKNWKHSWVCQCKCGNLVRRADSSQWNNKNAMCQECDRLEHLKARHGITIKETKCVPI